MPSVQPSSQTARARTRDFWAQPGPSCLGVLADPGQWVRVVQPDTPMSWRTVGGWQAMAGHDGTGTPDCVLELQ